MRNDKKLTYQTVCTHIHVKPQESCYLVREKSNQSEYLALITHDIRYFHGSDVTSYVYIVKKILYKYT